MEVRYKREINHNYMILDAPSHGGGYECRMLASNSIGGLLKFRVRQYEEKREFYYEITSRQPLKRLLEQRKISGEEIRALLLGISSVLIKIEEYLLKEEQILLDPEFIYIEPDQFTVSLCLLPGYSCDFPAALSELLRYLLEKINHKDREGVVLAYNLYQESLRENYGMADLLRHLSGSQDSIFAGEKSGIEQAGDEDEEREIEFEEERTQKSVEMEPALERRVGEWEKTENEKAIRSEIGRGLCIKSFLYAVIAIIGMEVMIWYLFGMDGLLQYGPMAAAAMMVVVAVKLWIFPRIGKNVRDVPGREAGERDQGTDSVQNEERWRFCPESESEYHKRKMEEAKREEWHAKEKGTILLAEKDEINDVPVFESLNREEKTIEIPYVPFVIGKHPELADFCLDRPTVSRLHLRVDKKEGVYIITDLNSTNGTAVGEYKLQANETVSIRSGDVICIADMKYCFIERKKGEKM